jgi:hypothetical protein
VKNLQTDVAISNMFDEMPDRCRDLIFLRLPFPSMFVLAKVLIHHVEFDIDATKMDGVLQEWY